MLGRDADPDGRDMFMLLCYDESTGATARPDSLDVAAFLAASYGPP